MQLTAKFIGTPVKRSDLQAGDIALLQDHNSLMLVLVTQEPDKLGMILLNEWSERTNDEAPHLLNFDAIHTYDIRRIDSELTVEPLTRTAEHVLSLPNNEPQNGGISILEDDDFVLRVVHKIHHHFYSLQTGVRSEYPEGVPHHEMSAWRLVWRDGEDSVTLCEFGVTAS
tara:strand:+ start:12911 stop:13420 length:510 start_codon:yes stop_codon:yes gene_type:complete